MAAKLCCSSSLAAFAFVSPRFSLPFFVFSYAITFLLLSSGVSSLQVKSSAWQVLLKLLPPSSWSHLLPAFSSRLLSHATPVVCHSLPLSTTPLSQLGWSLSICHISYPKILLIWECENVPSSFSFFQVSNGNYFGEDIKVAVLQTEFDKDVYLIDNLVCPRPLDWKPEKVELNDCLPCNYASKDKKVCGTSRLRNGQSSSKCKSKCDEDKVRLLCGSPSKEEWVSNAGGHVESYSSENKNENDSTFGSFPSPDEWTEVAADVCISGQVSKTGKSHYYRYYHPDPEVGFRVEIKTQYGTTNL
jgi:hypothetical protein